MAATQTSLPAPVGGWNARDSVAEMEPLDAVTLTNWFPATSECVLRNGYTKWATGLPGAVETLVAFSGAMTEKLFAISGNQIYDCSAPGPVGVPVMSGLTNSRFQYVNNATAGGNFVLAVNGADKLRYYDGSVWSVDGGSFTVTVADTSLWTNITLHKQRVWAIQKNTLKAWYLDTSAIAGTAHPFDMAGFFKMGGHLVAVETWTIDAGYGVDDYLVFVSSKGEVLIYQGTDPANADTWAVKGLYRIGSPIGTRCVFKYEGDLLLITQDGLVPLSGALQSSRVTPQVAVSQKIMYAVSSAISDFGSQFGWQVMTFPKQNQLILNIPIGVGQQQQYVMNTINKSWCNFTGWNANVWELFQDHAYFGSEGYVAKAWDGFSDAGMAIQGNALQAYNYFKTPGILKRFTMSRPIFRANGIPTVAASYSVDFELTDNTAPLAFVGAAASGKWNTAVWNSTTWSSTSLPVYKAWQGTSGIGYSAAPRIKVASKDIDLRWVSTDVVMERGAVL